MSLVLPIDERKSIDWPPLPPFFFFFRLLRLYRSHFKERQSFFSFFFFFSSFFFLYTPITIERRVLFQQWSTRKESTSCFNDLARSIRRFVVTISHREYTYIQILVKKYEKKNWPSSPPHHHSLINSFRNRLILY